MIFGTLMFVLQCHPTVVRLLWDRARIAILFTVGSRLAYTVASISYFPDPVNVLWLVYQMVASILTVFEDAFQVSAMLRNTKASQETGAGNAIQRMTHFVSALHVLLEIARHFAILYALDTALAAKRPMAVLPADWLGEELSFSNVELISVTFTAYIVLGAKAIFVRARSGGSQLALLTTRFNRQVVFVDDGAGHVGTSAADKVVAKSSVGRVMPAASTEAI